MQEDEHSTRISRDEQMMLHALVTSLRSTCGRKSVGAIIAIGGRVVSSGYAGPPSGFDHCTMACKELGALSGCQRTVHAEQNAVAYAARHGISTEGATLYCTDSPCLNCAKQLINTGIIRVCYLRPYRDTSGIDLLIQAGIPCEMITVHYARFMNLHQLYVSGGVPANPQ
jgi:dCMP deaminase